MLLKLQLQLLKNLPKNELLIENSQKKNLLLENMKSCIKCLKSVNTTDNSI